MPDSPRPSTDDRLTPEDGWEAFVAQPWCACPTADDCMDAPDCVKVLADEALR
jgi:hypothetical protein